MLVNNYQGIICSEIAKPGSTWPPSFCRRPLGLRACGTPSQSRVYKQRPLVSPRSSASRTGCTSWIKKCKYLKNKEKNWPWLAVQWNMNIQSHSRSYNLLSFMLNTIDRTKSSICANAAWMQTMERHKQTTPICIDSLSFAIDEDNNSTLSQLWNSSSFVPMAAL